ncbi:MAG: DEAD/DEAH box helicase family protein [Candidatus Omnitrophica bacterium]|nr:DEAD/DEAH box helicase family protein [Candidatus Omnitrophota bacterium]
MIELKKYQHDAADNLKELVEKALRSSENEVVIFQAPTGSGKTLMVSEALKRLVKHRPAGAGLSFVWVSVRMLHEQSKEKLERYYEDDRLIQCSYFDNLEDRRIAENEILFINWHSINKKDINIYVKENEQDNNLNSIVQNTKDEGRQIILIIDESHHTASSDKSRELIEVISPKATIEVSATPHLADDVSGIEKVRLGDVKGEEMIKSEISVNPEFMDIEIGSKSSDELVIEQALKKREELAKLLKKQGSEVNPLLLIQLPDRKGNLINKKDTVIEILRKKGITEQKGNLAIWLSEEKSDTLPNIEKNDNDVEVLVFKQAIALGWDCPRAAILVIFRESHSFVFTIQTIGRIMRMPELRYYGEEELNKGFVFTNLPNIEITEDYAKDYVTVYEAKRDDALYKEVALPSIYLRRQRERTRLSGKFVDIFLSVAEEYNLQKRITAIPSKVVNPIIADGRIVNIDQSGEVAHKGTVDVQLNEAELQDRFDRFVADMCTPFAPGDSSDRMKTALYQFFKKTTRIDKYNPRVQRIVLGKENVQTFVDTINMAKERFRAEVIGKLQETREKEVTPKWEIPAITSYNSRYKRQDKTRSIMKPFYVAKQTRPEEQFVEFLEDSKRAKWWFKNGESDPRYFAVLRTDGAAFYPDFIVQFDNGKIGIFDTKSGITAKDAKERAEGLQKYIKEQVKKGRKLWGGIVLSKDGSFRYNDSEVYSFDEKALGMDWKVLSFERVEREAPPVSTIAPLERIVPEEEEKYRTCVPHRTLKAAAGSFGEAQTVEPDGWVKVPTSRRLRPGMFVAQVVGRSMEPLIPSGSWCLFVGPVEGSRQGRIVLVQHRDIQDPETDGSYTVKRYRRTGESNREGAERHGEIRLEPLNPEFEPIILKNILEDEVQVIAELVEILKVHL